MGKYLRAACVALTVLAGTALAQSNGSANGVAPLRYTIELEVPKAQRELLEKHLDLYRWQRSEQMDEGQLRRLVRLAPEQIRELLSTEGYYAPRITLDVLAADPLPVVTVVVAPGAPTRVGEFSLRVTGPLDDGSAAGAARLAQLRAEWSMPVGAVFRHELWEKAKRASLQALLLEDYPTATIASSRAAVDVTTNTVVLEVTLDSGPAFTLGELDISGLQRYPPRVITTLNPIKPGDPYQQGSLLKFQSRLQDSPYFSGAMVTVATDPDHSERVPIRVNVTEHPSRKLGFGVGYSTDAGPRTSVDYSDLNLLDRAWRLSGGLKLDAKRQTLQGEVQLPLTDSGVRHAVSAQLEHTDIEGEITDKLVLGYRNNRTVDDVEITYGVRYFDESSRLTGGSGTRSSALVPSRSWTWRRLDSLLHPTQGHVVSVQIDAAAKALLSDQDLVRAHTRGAYYHPLTPRDQLIARAEAGVVVSERRTGIPSDLLFRTGGDQTVRGYAYQSLGVSEDGAIVGGRLLGVASLEYVRWFIPRWGAAAFVDAGNAVDRASEYQPAVGYGLGVRWKSPIAPLNFDLAYGERTRAVRLHFSIGIVF